MMLNLIKNGLLLLFIGCGLIAFQSCTKGDEYKKYTKNGEIIYTGKIDSLKVFSGKNRIKLVGELSADSKVTSYRIYWNSGADSVVVPVEKNQIGDSIIKIIDGLEENIYNFKLRTFDDDGNTSVPSFVTGKVYGKRYENTLGNRPLTTDGPRGDSVVITFATADINSGIFASEVKYTDNNNVMHSYLIPVDSTGLVLNDFSSGMSFQYRSLFLPDTTAIDIFYSGYDRVLPEVPIDEPPYLKNSSEPFLISDKSSGRYSTAADWVHNAGALSHNGYGLVDGKGGRDIINVVSGYGEPDIVNGKMYQRLKLLPGTYVYEVKTQGGTFTLDDQLYFTVALGENLPDVSDVETSDQTLGFKRVTNAIGSANDFLYTITFTLTESTKVAIGLEVTTKPGKNNYMGIPSFSLTKQ